MVKESAGQDRNFDDLAKRFKNNIYGGLKGGIRLAVLRRDCAAHLPIAPFTSHTKAWTILDAGGGQGQFSLQLAQAGHNLVICDISIEMLKLAQEQVELLGLQERVQLIHCALQDLSQHLPTHHQQFDFVICHAVMEWMLEPQSLLPHLLAFLRPQGFLSLTFYNVYSLIYKNLLRTNFQKILDRDFGGFRGSLTPINPLEPQQVMAWVNELKLQILAHSGIRVFHDYILNDEHRGRSPEALLAMELQLSQQEPFRSLGRYIHFLVKAQ